MSNNKQSSVDIEFVPHQESSELKELGFYEPCFAKYDFKKSLNPISWNMVWCENTLVDEIYAPTFSQAFRWFREKYGLYHSIGLDNSTEEDVNCDFNIINHDQSISELETDFKNYEEAELACLKKLIEIVKGANK